MTMLNFDPKRFLSSVAASYGKRLLEKPYDKLSQTEFFQELKAQPKLAKLAMEAASYALTALFEQNANDRGLINGAINEIATDVFPELSKRLHNGDPTPIAINAEKYTAKLQRPEDRLFVQVLINEFGLEKVKLLADWLKTATPEEKSNILKHIKGLEGEKAIEMVKVSVAEASEIFAVFEEPKIEPPKEKREVLPLTLSVFEQRLDSYIAKNKKETSDGK